MFAKLDFIPTCSFAFSEVIKFPPVSKHRKPISSLMGPITWLIKNFYVYLDDF